MGREDEVRLIAYNIWEEENCPDGRDCEHWFKAEVVWEEQKKRAATSAKAKSKHPVKPRGKSRAGKTKSQKT
jgi:hypothetical protein